MAISRRRFLVAGAVGGGTAAGFAWWHYRTGSDSIPYRPPPDPQFPNALRVPGADGMHGIFEPGGSFTIVSRPLQYDILPGKPTTLLGYAVEHAGKTLINPLLRIRSGANLRVRYWNALDETSIVHWHGLKVDTNNDGHPHYAVSAGKTYDYQFTVSNRAGTYWYHPHPHHLAGKQTYLGLAGFLVVEDNAELELQRALDLALGVTDIPLLLQDKRLADDGALHYAPDGQEQFLGYLGERVLVNLTPSPCLDCTSRLYRLRLINGSNARTYRLAFMHGTEPLGFHVIGADGGLLDLPVSAREVFLSPSERADILLDLRQAAIGERIVLKSLPFDAMQFSNDAHAVHAQSGSIPGNGAALDLMLIRVISKTRYDRTIPSLLSRAAVADAGGAAHRAFAFDHSHGLWHINRTSYGISNTAFSVQRGAIEIWEFSNPQPGMPHPVHVHGVQYRVLERSGSPPQIRALATDGRGLQATELGWKDSVLLWPGETLRLLLDFSHPFPGDQVYILQCHNLEHETQGMMVNFKVAA